MENLKYKLIIADYDGTLTIGETVPPETVEAIADFRKAGGKFVLCSGRTPESAFMRMRENRIQCDAIAACQGSIIKVGEKVVLHEGLSAEQFYRIAKGIDDKFHRDFITYTNETLYYSGDGKECSGYVKWSVEPRKEKLEHIYDLAQMYPDNKFAKLLVMKGKEEDIGEIYDYIEKNFPEEVVANSGGYTILEIVSSKYTKYDACRIITEMLGVKESETITIGDSTNDFPLLDFGWALAPENAKPALKEKAKRVLEHVNDRPIEKLIRRLLAGENP